MCRQTGFIGASLTSERDILFLLGIVTVVVALGKLTLNRTVEQNWRYLHNSVYKNKTAPSCFSSRVFVLIAALGAHMHHEFIIWAVVLKRENE